MSPDTNASNELLSLLSRARRRWRLRVALGGLGLALGGALVVVIVASYAMERWQYATGAVTAARVAAWVALLALVAWRVVVPLVRRVPDAQVALYLEEHDPTLDAALLSAVEQVSPSRATPEGAPVVAHSPALTRKLVESALARARVVEARAPERRPMQRSAAIAGGVALAGLALLLLGPASLRQGARLLVVPWRTAEAAEVYAVAVEPGDTKLAKGGDQEVSAALRGFTSEEAELVVRRGAAGGWERIPMSTGADSSRFVARLFDLDEQTQYFVESNGVRSPVYTIEVTNLPAVRRIDLEYRYPAYTGMAPQKVEDGGDVAALAGTTVRLRASPTMPVKAGRIVVDGQPPLPMTLDSTGALTGELRVTKPGFYRVELEAQDGSMVRGSLDYTIDVLDDNAPTVTFRTPGRDLKVTSLEEVFAEATAEDDYGVQALELVYTVNGGAEKTVALHRGRALREVTGGHTFYLEEQGLQPGDVVSYYARAKDGTSHTSATDIYFMEIKPFEKEYRQAEQGGAPQQGEGEESPSALSQRQREIVAATFKTVRDSATLSAAERRDNTSTIALAQGQLRERVETLARRLGSRGVMGADSAMQAIAEALPRAADAMREAEELLGRRKASDALPPEQRALQHLQRAEAAYREVQVAFGQQQGGGGGEQRNPEELADLFELDVDKLRNQYESVQRDGRTEAGDRKVDETLERLRALAARQQQENERAQRRAEAMRQSGGASGGGQSQRQLAEETAEAARQLERLARERQSQELAESARRLQDAASAMRRSAAAGKDASTAEGARALDRLQDARRLLDRERGGRLQRDAQDAQRAADELAARQREIASDVNRLQQQQQQQGTGGRDAAALAQQLTQRKDELARDVEQLEGQLDRLSRDARRDQREAARKLQEAAGAIRDRRIPDKVRYSRNTMRGASPDYARSFEEQIGADLDDTRRRVSDAVGSMGQGGERPGAEALDKARELVRGLESLRERTQPGQQQGQPGQQEGQPGQQQGRSGQQPGQQGQQAGPGQGQQAQSGQPMGGRAEVGGAGRGAAIGGARGALTPEQVRQLAREYRERREGAEALRRELSRSGVGAEELDALIRQLRALESQRTYQDAEEVTRLQASVVDGFKEFEFALRRQLADEGDGRPVLGGAQEVSPRFRALVEEYYRSLGRGRP